MTWWLILLLLVYFGVILMLIGIILIQSGKGGGLSSLAQASGGISDAIGATGVEKTLNKLTTYIATAFIVMAMGISLLSSARSGKRSASEILGEGATPGATATTPGAPMSEGSVPPPPPGGDAGPAAPIEASEDLLNAIPPPSTEGASAPSLPAPEGPAMPAPDAGSPTEAAPDAAAPVEEPATP